MNARTRLTLAGILVVGALARAGLAEPEPLNRSIYVPIEFALCEHLGSAVLYQDDVATAAMPAKRVFQFTYYPELERLLPEVVQVRVEGAYADESAEPFIARLAVTVNGVHTAHRTKELDTLERLRKQRHKIDVRLEPKKLQLRCERYCKRSEAADSN